MKTQKLLAVLSLMLLVTACGKNMSLQVGGAKGSAQGTTENTEVLKTGENKNSLTANEDVQAFSEYDTKDTSETLGDISASDLKRRATVQVAAKESITEVIKMELILRNPMLKVDSKSEICLLSEDKDLITNERKIDCREITISTENETKLDLLEVFGLKDKTLAEKVDFIYSHSTAFADPGYRKFRMIIKGVSSVECGELTVQTSLDKVMPADMATKPTSYENGTTDITPAASAPAPAPAPKVTAAQASMKTKTGKAVNSAKKSKVSKNKANAKAKPKAKAKAKVKTKAKTKTKK